MEFISNHDFTDSEFERLRTTLETSDLLLPTTDDVENKLKEIKKALDYRMSEQDIDTVSRRFRFRCLCNRV